MTRARSLSTRGVLYLTFFTKYDEYRSLFGFWKVRCACCCLVCGVSWFFACGDAFLSAFKFFFSVESFRRRERGE
jgi:hypothetical protein